MGEQLSNPSVRQENVYNMAETAVMPGDADSVKVLVARKDRKKRRGVGVQRTMITAVEYVAADARCLSPLIIWPGKALYSTWIVHEMPGWHYACSENGYINSAINLYWIHHVFDPATRERANGRPRILITDGFSTHESVDVLTFYEQLTKQNNEKKVRQGVKDRKIGKAKVMAYEDIVAALEEREQKEQAKKKKGASKNRQAAESKHRSSGRPVRLSNVEKELREIEANGLQYHRTALY